MAVDLLGSSVPGEPSSQPPASLTASEPKSLYLVLEGGGAKGIAHVAAWDALEEILVESNASSERSIEPGRDRYELREVAGTSAGAIVGALIAAGARSNQLLDADGRMPLADALFISRFYDLFGVSGWRRLRLWRFILSPKAAITAAASRIAGGDREENWETNMGRRYLRWLRRRRAPIAQELYRVLVRVGQVIGQVGRLLLYLPRSVQHRVRQIGRLFRSISRLTLLFLLAAAAIFLLGWAVDGFLMSRPQAAGLDFVAFWILARLWMGANSLSLRAMERRGAKARQRHVGRWARRALHPLTAVVGAGALTYLLHMTRLFDNLIKLRSGLPQILGDGILYSLCVFLVAFTIIAYLRNFVKGAVNTRDLRDDINRALVHVLHGDCAWDATRKRYVWTEKPGVPPGTLERGALITFHNIKEATQRDLSVVAADTIKNEVRVYCTATHPHFPVANAVAASLAIPFAFRPLRMSTRLLVDGGLVSSIPAWVFRRHRTRDPDARILAVGIAPAETDDWIPIYLAARRARIASRLRRRKPVSMRNVLFLMSEPLLSLLWPLRFLSNVAYTSAYGARSLELEASDRLDNFVLTPHFELLDFDKTQTEAKVERDRLKPDAAYHIKDALWGRKIGFERICSKIEQALLKRAGEAGNFDTGARIRIYWAEHEERVDAVRIKRTFNFTPDELDDRLVIPYKASVAGWAADQKVAHFGDRLVLDGTLEGRINRYRRFVKWKELCWCWAIPVREARAPHIVRGLLVVESNRPIEYFGQDLGIEGAERASSWLEPGVGLRRNAKGAVVGPRRASGGPFMTALEAEWEFLAQSEFIVPLKRSRLQQRRDRLPDILRRLGRS